MAILGVKTGLIVSIQANVTPKTYLRWRLDTGAGLADSNEQVPLGNTSTASWVRQPLALLLQSELSRKRLINYRMWHWYETM